MSQNHTLLHHSCGSLSLDLQVCPVLLHTLVDLKLCSISIRVFHGTVAGRIEFFLHCAGGRVGDWRWMTLHHSWHQCKSYYQRSRRDFFGLEVWAHLCRYPAASTLPFHSGIASFLGSLPSPSIAKDLCSILEYTSYSGRFATTAARIVCSG